MSYPLPRIPLSSSNDLQNYMGGSNNYALPNQDTYMIGNTVVGSPTRFASPTGGLMNTDYFQMPDTMSPHNRVLGINSPLNHPNSPGFSHRSPFRSASYAHGQSPLMLSNNDMNMNGMPYNYGGMNRNFQPQRNSIDMNMMNMSGGGNGFGMQDTAAMPQAVENYFDKQNMLMARILRNIDDYKKTEFMKQKVMLEQQLGRLDEPYSPLQNMQSQSRVDAYSPLYPRSKFRSETMNPNPVSPGDVQSFFAQKKIPTSPPMFSPMRQPDSMASVGSTLELPTPKKKDIWRTPINTDRSEATMAIKYPSKLESSPFKKKVLDTLVLNQGLDSETLYGSKGRKRRGHRSRGKEFLKVIGWTMAIPGLWWMSIGKLKHTGGPVKHQPEQRQEKEEEDEGIVPTNLETFVAFAARVLEPEIKRLVNNKNSMVLVMPPGKKNSNIDKKCKMITDHIVEILDNLSIHLSYGKLPQEFFQFLASISEDGSQLPDNFLSGLEMDRLVFNEYGRLKQMTSLKSKMMLMSFTLLKGLLNFLIMRPWVAIPSIKEQDVNLNNLVNVGSVFYRVVIDLIEDSFPKAEENSDAVRPFRAVPPLFSAVETSDFEKLDVVPDNNEQDMEEIISGLYTKDQVSAYFKPKNESKTVDKVRQSVIDFLDEMYSITHKTYLNSNGHKGGARVAKGF